ncbi:zinc finger SWIM domain-containing protein 8 isoform X1 [Hydra vulgaris]|uniref:zinc finger SWIM domain-containing protein 8 isoform X1 n=1 Tax=Hydra vulgaris TaxID=6087 RepID=UPI001F5EEEEC|nr:zinc finger SWIM domain-containing protein 8 [Hydra vulgaris]
MWMVQHGEVDNGNIREYGGGSDMDIVSFEDSEQFEEGDSGCSWVSETEQVLNWSGWKRLSPTQMVEKNPSIFEVLSLMELCSKTVALNYPFEIIEHHKRPIPESLQLRIAFWSFPDSEEEIRLYSCLSCGSNEKYKLGEILAKTGNVCDVLQIGFHLSGVVTQPVSHTPAKQVYKVAITFDRGRITSCQCTCCETATWCEHITAVCLYRVINKNSIVLRAPVSESLTKLDRDQLQKFAQYLISGLPPQILPTAQRLLDQLLSSKESEINILAGAPDPTAGASLSEEANWVLDKVALCENIKKILARFCGPTPLFYLNCDASNTLTAPPPISMQWSNYIRSFQGHEPEALWNLLFIVRHMSAQRDKNSEYLLEYITKECLLCYQMMYYWVTSSSSFQVCTDKQNHNGNLYGQLHSKRDLARHSSAHLMDEIVKLWELIVMSPHLSAQEKANIMLKLQTWNDQVKDAARKGQGQTNSNSFNVKMYKDFSGFKTAQIAGTKDWQQFYSIIGLSQDSAKELSRYGVKFDNCITDTIFGQLVSLLPPDTDEFYFLCKLSEALLFHGHKLVGISLAHSCAQKIISSYPEKCETNEINCISMTEKTNILCSMMQEAIGNEKLIFDLAIIGLTVPHLPTASTKDEIRLTCLEMDLYKRLKSMSINEYQYASLRYQCQKIINNPMLRGDFILPLLISTFIFEILCDINVTSTVLYGQPVILAPGLKRQNSDSILGYQCALITLGLYSSAVDIRHPMLCESIRHQRLDLALSLLTYCRMNESQVNEVLSTILDKERYVFLKQVKPQKVASTAMTAARPNTEKETSLNKHGFTFADVHTAIPPAQSHGKHSSDSDSGNCETERTHSKAAPVLLSQSRKQQRRQARSVSKNSRNEKKLRNDRTTLKSKVNLKKVSAKNCFEQVESDSGQEMYYCFEGDGFSRTTDNWDSETTGGETISESNIPIKLNNSVNKKPATNQNYQFGEYDKIDKIFGEKKSALFEKRPDQSESYHNLHEPNITLPLLLSTENSKLVFDKPSDLETGIDDDFNIKEDMFKTNRDGGFDVMLLDQINKNSDKNALASTEILVGQSTELISSLTLSDEKSLFQSFSDQPKLYTPSSTSQYNSCDLFLEESNISVKKKTPQDEKPRTEVEEQSNFNILTSFNENQPAVLTDIFNSEFSGNPSSSDSQFDDSLIAYSKSPSFDSGTEQKTNDNKLTISNSLNTKTGDSSFVCCSNDALTSSKLKDSNVNDNINVSKKQKKSKKKKQKNGNRVSRIDIQSIEAEGYSLFELAKLVLKQARNATTSYIPDVDEVSSGCSVNRVLQLAAFQIGLFALQIHNCSSPNWFSRTYSSYVSWIENLAVEIGASALRILNEKWEDILTPSECVQIASRASRSGDTLLKRTAAELALTCLPRSQSLNQRDINLTITMCREQSEEMLERACSSVESAGRHGGIQPELLFRIAREWHYLHEEKRKREGTNESNNTPRVRSENVSPNHFLEPSVFITAEQFVQDQMHQKAQEFLGRQLHRSSTQDHVPWFYPPYSSQLHHCPLPQQVVHSKRIQNIDSYCVPLSNFPDELNLSEIPRCLQNSYRVGMKALEALSLRMPDKRPEIKYALAPPSSEDIRWMCALAASLGPPYLKNFCKVVLSAVSSPYLLHDLALEAARHFALYNPAQLASHLRSPSVSPIVQKALLLFTELVHHDLVLLVQPGYADFVDLLRRTRSAFCMAPGGMTRFNEILEVIRKTYPKKKELWQLIMNGLSKA